MTELIIGLLITMLLSAFFSGMEIAFVSSNRMLAEMDKEKGGMSQRCLSLFYRHPNNQILSDGYQVKLTLIGRN